MPPFFSRGFNGFCEEYCIELNLTSPYIPEGTGAAERGVGLIKVIMRKTEKEGSDFEEALAVFKNTRNKSSYSPNQLFYLRNWRAPNLPHVQKEPVVEEMVKVMDKIRNGRKVKNDELKKA